MGVRSRVTSSLLAGGLVTGALVLGAPAAAALPSVTGSCGGSVSAEPGDTVYGPGGVVLGTAGSSSGAVSGLLGLVRCTVNVTIDTGTSAASGAASGAGSGVKSGAGAAAGAVDGATGVLKGGGEPTSSGGGTRASSSPTAAGSTTTTGSPVAPVSAGAGVPAPAGTATLADAPLPGAFVPMFAGLPSSFLASAAPGASAVSAAGTYDPALLLGGAPMYRVAVPSLLGDPTTAVTSASQLQALPIDGLGGGLGVPAVLAVLVAAGAAAVGVRRAVLGRRVLPSRPELSRLLHRSADEGTAAS